MSEWRLTYRNLVYYARYYRLIALATVIRYQLFFPGGYDS